MAINYAKAQATALRLLTDNGRPVTLVKYDTDPDDPNRPWRGSEGSSTITATAVFTDPVSEKDLGAAEVLVGDSSVKTGEKIAFLAAAENLDASGNPVDLTEYDQLIDGGLAYRMVEIHALSPGPTPLMYEVRLER